MVKSRRHPPAFPRKLLHLRCLQWFQLSGQGWIIPRLQQATVEDGFQTVEGVLKKVGRKIYLKPPKGQHQDASYHVSIIYSSL